MLQLILLHLFFSAGEPADVKKFNIIENVYFTAFMKNLVYKLDDFELIVHVDGTTKHIANSHLRDVEKFTTVTVYNHDFDIATFRRPPVPKCINFILIADPASFSGYLKHQSNVLGDDIVIFVLINQDIGLYAKDYWLIPYLDRAGNVVVINHRGSFAEIYTLCFYCGVEREQLVLFQNGTHDEAILPVKRVLPRSFKDFGGHTMKVGFKNYYPYIFCIKKTVVDGRIRCKEAGGVDYHLLQLLSKKMNFTFTLIRAENNSYKLLFDDLKNGDVDFVIGGISMTSHRARKFRFSNALKIESIVFMYTYELPFLRRAFIVLFPYSCGMWLLIFGTLLGITALIALFAKLLFKAPCEVYSAVFGLLAKMAIEQPLRFRVLSQTKTLSLPILISAWLLFAITINIGYKSRLSSIVTHPPPRSLHKLHDLLDEGYAIVMDKSGSNSIQEIFNDTDRELIENHSYMVITEHVCQAITYIQDHKATVIGEFARIYYHSGFYCNYIVDQRIRVATAGKSTHGWLFDMGAPFVKAFDQHIHAVTKGGFMQAWEKMTLHRGTLSVLSRQAMMRGRMSNHRSDFRSYTSQFALYLTGISLSIICFLCELLYGYWRRKCRLH